MFGDANEVRSWAASKQQGSAVNGASEADRMLGNSMADRMAQLLQDIERDSSFIDDEIGDLSTSFANKAGIF
jgi:hypothetical protein